MQASPLLSTHRVVAKRHHDNQYAKGFDYDTHARLSQMSVVEVQVRVAASVNLLINIKN